MVGRIYQTSSQRKKFNSGMRCNFQIHTRSIDRGINHVTSNIVGRARMKKKKKYQMKCRSTRAHHLSLGTGTLPIQAPGKLKEMEAGSENKLWTLKRSSCEFKGPSIRFRTSPNILHNKGSIRKERMSGKTMRSWWLIL